MSNSDLLSLTERPSSNDPVWDEDQWKRSRARYQRQRRKKLGSQALQIRIRQICFDQQGGLCHWCGRKMVVEQRALGQPAHDDAVTLEHLVSHLDGGATTLENCRAACNLCNLLRGRLAKAVRMTELAMRNGFEHEVHFYASRLQHALSEWELRTAQSEVSK